MTKSFKQTVYFFTLLALANIAALMVTQANDGADELGKLWDSLPGILILSTLFRISCQWKPHTNIRLFFLPLFRTVFWAMIVAIGFWNDRRMESEDLLLANNEFLFSWWRMVTEIASSIRHFSEFGKLFLVDILGVAVVELLLIVVAVFLEKRIRFFHKSRGL